MPDRHHGGVNLRRGPTTVFAVSAAGGIVLSAVAARGVNGTGLYVVSFDRSLRSPGWSLLALLGVWAACWAVAVVAALRMPRRAIGLIVVFGLAIRVAALAGPPSISNDLFRYAWDGRVQASHIDPYAYPPGSPQLTHLRESWLWPDADGCRAIHVEPGCTRINRYEVRTIYPPVAEAWFAAVYRLAGTGARHKAWQLAGLATELGVLALLPAALRRHGRDPRWTALYALCPAPVVDVVNNGHVDGLAIFLVVAALLIVEPPVLRSRLGPVGRDLAVGALIGGAVAVKLYPALLLLALLGATRRAPLVSWLRTVGAATTVVLLVYLPHVVAVGWKVLGYLPGYLREEKYSQGGRFLLAGLLRLPPHAAAAASVLAVGVAVLWAAVRRPTVPQAACVILGVSLLAASPVQSWYAISLLAVVTVAARPVWAAVLVAGYPYYWAVIVDDRHMKAIGQASYSAAALVVVIAAIVHRRHAVRPFASDSAGRAEEPAPV
jgi:hypothetical protein